MIIFKFTLRDSHNVTRDGHERIKKMEILIIREIYFNIFVMIDN